MRLAGFKLGDRVKVDDRQGVVVDTDKAGCQVRLFPFKMEKVWVMVGNLRKDDGE